MMQFDRIALGRSKYHKKCYLNTVRAVEQLVLAGLHLLSSNIRVSNKLSDMRRFLLKLCEPKWTLSNLPAELICSSQLF